MRDVPKAGRRIRSQQEYEQRLKMHDKYHKQFQKAVNSKNMVRLVDAQVLLPFLNKEFKHIREWEKGNSIYRYPAIKVGKVTYQVL